MDGGRGILEKNFKLRSIASVLLSLLWALFSTSFIHFITPQNVNAKSVRLILIAWVSGIWLQIQMPHTLT